MRDRYKVGATIKIQNNNYNTNASHNTITFICSPHVMKMLLLVPT